MTFSSVREFSDQGELEIFPPRFPGVNLNELLTENLVRGCTVTLNASAVEFIKLYEPRSAIMHDWWIALLIKACGEISWNTEPEVMYRIHDTNVIGAAPNLRVRTRKFSRNFISSTWAPAQQVREMFLKYEWSMRENAKIELDTFLVKLSSPLLLGRINLVFGSERFRSKLIDEIAIRALILCKKRQKEGRSFMAIFLYTRLKRVIAGVTFYLYSIPTRVKTWVAFRITGTANKQNLVKSGIQDPGCHQVAILALFPRKAILNSTLRLIDTLLRDQVHVVCVINISSMSEEWISEISNRNVTLVTRENIGRDFGAYKAGFKFCVDNDLLANATKLIFANDSVFYGENSKTFLQDILNMDESWLAMFVNYQYHTHGQSFFQIFDKTVFNTQAFAQFWDSYYPSELRHLAINNGEVGLSNVCLNSGFSAVPYVTSGRIEKSPKFDEFSYDETFALWSNHGHAFLDKTLVTRANSIHQLRRTFLELNATHHAGLLASRVLAAPLKLDIFQTGLATREGIENTLNSLQIADAEASEVLGIMTHKGTHSSKKGFRKLWNSFGYI